MLARRDPFRREFCLTETGWLTAEYPSVASLWLAARIDELVANLSDR